MEMRGEGSEGPAFVARDAAGDVHTYVRMYVDYLRVCGEQSTQSLEYIKREPTKSRARFISLLYVHQINRVAADTPHYTGNK